LVRGHRRRSKATAGWTGRSNSSPGRTTRAKARSHGSTPTIFTEFGSFGSLDWRGEQVDEGTYQIVDDRSFTIGDATFHFTIEGDAIRFEPVLPDRCAGFDCVWMLAVASPGYTWERVSP
jgi:hypothetical protein